MTPPPGPPPSDIVLTNLDLSKPENRILGLNYFEHSMTPRVAQATLLALGDKKVEDDQISVATHDEDREWERLKGEEQSDKEQEEKNRASGEQDADSEPEIPTSFSFSRTGGDDIVVNSAIPSAQAPWILQQKRVQMQTTAKAPAVASAALAAPPRRIKDDMSLPVVDAAERSIKLTWKLEQDQTWLAYKDSCLLGRLHEVTNSPAVEREFKDGLQLSVAFLNFGNPNQKFRAPDGSTYRPGPAQHNILCRFVTSANYFHLVALCEASGFKEPESLELFRDAGLSVLFGEANPEIAFAVRRPGTLRLLHEHERKGVISWACAEASFQDKKEDMDLRRVSGATDANDVTITRAGYQKVRIVCFHICAKAARDEKGMRRIRGELNELFAYIATHRVDMVGGDANGAAQIATFRQQQVDVTNCLFNRMMRNFQSSVNSGLPLSKRLSLYLEDNTPYDNHLRNEDYDCMVAAFLGWGKTEGCREQRKTLRASGADTVPECGLFAVDDLKVSSSERAKLFSEDDMWLMPQNTNWHRPLVVTIREKINASKRGRSDEGLKKRQDRWKNKKAKSAWTEGQYRASGDRAEQGSWQDKTQDWKQSQKQDWNQDKRQDWKQEGWQTSWSSTDWQPDRASGGSTASSSWQNR